MVVDVVSSPYANVVIPLNVSSTTGMKYRQFNCLECGHEFIERQADVMYRIGDSDNPPEIHITDGVPVAGRCPNCAQLYELTVSTNVIYDIAGIPLYAHPQSIYLVSEPVKKLRYLYCMECGKAFQTISDRIAKMSDNRVPFEYVNPQRLGPIEAICTFDKCAQLWSLIV